MREGQRKHTLSRDERKRKGKRDVSFAHTHTVYL